MIDTFVLSCKRKDEQLQQYGRYNSKKFYNHDWMSTTLVSNTYMHIPKLWTSETRL